MKRVLATLFLAAVLILLGVVLARRFRHAEPVAPPQLAFTRPGVAEVRNPSKAQTIDVYDAAAWSVISPLSEQSIALGSAPVKFPDFTRGKWVTRRKIFGLSDEF